VNVQLGDAGAKLVIVDAALSIAPRCAEETIAPAP